MTDLAAILRANAKEPHMTIGGRPFAIEAANAIEALTAEVELYRSRWLSCVTPEEAERMRNEIIEQCAKVAEDPKHQTGEHTPFIFGVMYDSARAIRALKAQK